MRGLSAAAAVAAATAMGALACGGDASKHAPDARVGSAAGEGAGRIDAHGGAGKAPVEPIGPPPEPGPVLFDLLANRLLAHLVWQGGALVDGESPGMWKNVRGGWGNGWEPAVPVGGAERAALLTSRSDNISFPLTDAAALEARELWLRVMPPHAGTRISVFLNERPLGDQTLAAAGFQILRIKLAPGTALAGENVLRIFSGGKGTLGGRPAYLSLSRMWVGKAGVADPPGAAAYFEPGAGRLRLPGPGDALAWYVQVPARARLWLNLDAAGGCGVDVTVHEDAAPPVVLGRLVARGAPVALDLSTVGGRTVRLELSLVGEGCGKLGLRDAALVGPPGPPSAYGPAALALPGAGAAGAGPAAAAASLPPVDHVVLWVVDAMRADLLDAYGGVDVDTPNMDAAARAGTVFLNASVQGSESKAGAATLFTGTYPTVSKMVRDTDRLPARLPVLPELFRAAGWRTASFISNGYVSGTWGFDRGWDKHLNFVRESMPSHAGKVWENARAWLVAEKPAHAFLYLQPADTHVPYRAHDGILERYDPDPYDGPFKKIVTGFDTADFVSGKTKWSDRDKTRVLALYHNAVTYNDRVFGEMMKDLPALLKGRVLVMVSSDHGEEMFDHGSIGHGTSLYSELTHVPLILEDSGEDAHHFPPGTVVRDDVETLDVLPTLMAAAHVSVPPTAQGRDLGPLARAATEVRYVRPAFSFHLDWWRAVRIGVWKLHLRGGKGALLYDLEADPGEKTDVSASRPIALRHCLDALAFFMAYSEKWHKPEHGDAANHSAALAAALEKAGG
ncbi:MAG TPA: sulfatase [Myxococcota bacterium]|jgi:arylsulfatase A-like enzyme|nr:sulfatase [Myxococcota bacterium]